MIQIKTTEYNNYHGYIYYYGVEELVYIIPHIRDMKHNFNNIQCIYIYILLFDIHTSMYIYNYIYIQ